MQPSTRTLLPILLAVAALAACGPGLKADPARDASAVPGLGILVANKPLSIGSPSEYRLEDGKLYRGVAFRLGKVNVVLPAGTDGAALAGRLVRFTYVEERDLTRLLVLLGPAPAGYGERESMQQLRSDWCAPETGFTVGQSTRARLAALSFLRVVDIAPYAGFSLRVTDGGVATAFTNEFQSPLTGIRLLAHYEHGPGKPHPEYVPRTMGDLAPGAGFTAVFPVQHTPAEARRAGTFDSLVFEGTLQGKTVRFEAWPGR